MKLIAIDTSTENCSVALLNEDSITFKSEVAPQKHAEIVLEMLDTILKESSLSKDDLDGLVLGIGPGSFTGVRIAASTVQGLALGLNLKVAKITSLEALAIEALSKSSASYVVSSIDARMGEVYIAVYKVEGSALTLLSEEKVLKPEDAVAHIKQFVGEGEDVICAGSGVDILKNAGMRDYPKHADFPQAQYLLNKGAELLSLGKGVDPEDALPLYVRNEVTWKKVSEQ